ncbi:hypothetical protein L596_011103 [Steinernema carpocapsae]|uniref:Zinc finger ZPR1-type domain-containing protein n=1 Tax=Steinernema carpocapsae TaxID=34508 RepID=A0A4U5NTB2_STECR|nr:hypothetical protein L596_011103 [Steinernema carpocapsae]
MTEQKEAAAPTTSLYSELSADDVEQRPMEIESLCMQCHENGTTRLMCTRIPYYRQVILVSFSCDHCGYRNNELQSGEAAQEHGTEIVLNVKLPADLNRQIVKSEYAQLEVPELELVIPYKSQTGEVTTVEGVLSRVKSGLLQNQDLRRIQNPEGATKIDAFIEKMDHYLELKEPFTLKLTDPSGNCFIQNPDPLHVDPRCITSHYCRRLADRKLLGFADDDEVEDEEAAPEWRSYEDAKHEVLRFATECPNCGAPTETLMKPTDIPFFQTVIIMSTTCDACGNKTNEVKSGSSIRDYGCKTTVTIKEDVDLARDVLKSDTCNLSIPELELDVGYGALAGRFTTVEGLLGATRDQLVEQGRFFFGDSASEEEREKMTNLIAQFDDAIALKRVLTIVLDDPAGNSYVQSLTTPFDDPRLQKEFYERSFEHKEMLGLNDMKVENYGEMDAIEEAEEEHEQKNEEAACS